MNIFQVVVIGTLVTLLGGSVYYFIKADNHGILSQSIAGNRLGPNQERMVEVAGNYACTPTSGCQDSYNLNLNEDGTFALATSYTDGAETLAEKGDWSIIKMGFITLTIVGNQSANYDIPKTILIKSVGTSTLSRILYYDKQYNDMKNPIFSKAQE